MYLATIAQLQAQTSVPLNTEFIVGGHTTVGDGGGGTFIWIAAGPAPSPDSGIILDGADSSGYFQRIYSGPINVRWFGAKGDGVTDDTNAVNAARNSIDFANNGTLYFPKGRYAGSFIFDWQSTYDPQELDSGDPLSEINIKGDGHGTVLCSRGKQDPNALVGDPVAILGRRLPNQSYAKVSDLTISGTFTDSSGVSTDQYSIGVQFANPTTAGLDEQAGYWVFERVFFVKCYIGVHKPYGNIGNHFIDCTWHKNVIGVSAQDSQGMHNGCDRYTGGHFAKHITAALRYLGSGTNLIIDGAVIEAQSSHPTWGIYIASSGTARMWGRAVCIRNVYFENNGNLAAGGGDMYFEGIRSVRIDDCTVSAVRMRLIDSSVNLYNCRIGKNAGAVDLGMDVDEKSSLVAYEHRYTSFPTSRIFVNSISYDGTLDIEPDGGEYQSTSVWGPLRCVTTTRSHFLVSEQFDTAPVQFDFDAITPPTIQNTNIVSARVLGNGSGMLVLNSGDTIYAANLKGTIGPDPVPKYIVWSIHTYLVTKPPIPINDQEQIYGEIKSATENLGHAYFKYDQWACSYGMKLVDISSGTRDFRLYFTSSFAATFYITDYQILAFDDLQSANAFLNSREFCIPAG